MVNITDAEQAQIESFKQWWHRYGKLLLIVLIVVLAIYFGWRYWKGQQQQAATQASTLYQQAINSFDQKNYVDFERFTNTLNQEYKRSIYTDLANLLVVKRDVHDKKLTKAETNLNSIIRDSRYKVLRTVARLRLARVYIAENKFGQAFATLENVNDTEFAVWKYEILGDAYAAQDERKKAHEAYQQALNALKSSPELEHLRPFLTMKSNHVQS